MVGSERLGRMEAQADTPGFPGELVGLPGEPVEPPGDAVEPPGDRPADGLAAAFAARTPASAGAEASAPDDDAPKRTGETPARIDAASARSSEAPAAAG